MKDVSEKNFGLVIAYLLPGFICLWGLSFSSNEIAAWLANSSAGESPSVGGFLYATLASLAIGLVLSALRWLVIDHFHYWTGIPPPSIDFSELRDADKFAAFQAVVEAHYRHYQYYSNTLVGIIVSFLTYIVRGPDFPSWYTWVAVVAILIALFCGSRDAMRKYFVRAEKILGVSASEEKLYDKSLGQAQDEAQSQEKGQA